VTTTCGLLLHFSSSFNQHPRHSVNTTMAAQPSRSRKSCLIMLITKCSRLIIGLLTLPAELRNHIYRKALTVDEPVYLYENLSSIDHSARCVPGIDLLRSTTKRIASCSSRTRSLFASRSVHKKTHGNIGVTVALSMSECSSVQGTFEQGHVRYAYD
jgi:hypothetical protein